MITHRSDALPGKELRETPTDCCGSGPGGGDAPAAAGRRHHPSGRTDSPTRFLTGLAGGSSPSLLAEQQSSQQIQVLRR